LIDHFGINFNKFKIKGCKKEEKWIITIYLIIY
jgi:hypothetical protein